MAEIEVSSEAGSHLVRCSRCGADTTYPPPTEAELDAAYAGAYRPEGGRFSGPGDRLLRRTRGRLAGRLDEIAPPGPILDVGAGKGALLDALEQRGREAVGTERSDQDLEAARAKPGPERSAGTDAEGEWAAIVFWHSLEHLSDAGARVAALGSSLAPDGVAVISIPNRASLQARAFGDRWLHLDLPRHLVHVPAPALFEALHGAGLRVERVSYLLGGQVVFGWLHGLVGTLPGSPSLYDAIRRPEARSRPLTSGRRLGILALAVALLPVAAALALVEALARRGGTVYVEARRV
jgi:SAM-dependent methyltransferase